MKRRFLSLILFCILALPGLVAFVPARQSVIQLAVSVGYNGYFRKGQWTPVRVLVSNGGDNLDGEIRVRTGSSGGLAETTYSTPLDLPKGARKQLFLYVSLESYSQKIQVEVVDGDGHVAGRQSATILAVNPGDILLGVVTESPFGSVDLSASMPGTGTGYQINWRVDDIPTLSDALAGLDVLMFHDIDTGTLRAEQVAAITNWVLSGGHLIVAGGEFWQRTTAGFGALLPVSLEGAVPVASLAPLADYLRLPAEPLNVEATATDTTPAAGAQVLVAAGDVPLIVRKSYGEGVIDFLAVDPHSEPLRSWTEKNQLWYMLVASVGPRPSWADEFDSWSMAREATLTTSSTVLPTFLQLCGFLVMYVVLVGPINYLVLKRLNRRELAWFTIPALILIFSVLAYSVGFNLRGNVATVNRLTVARVWADSEQAQVTSLIGVQSPRRSSYDIAVDRGYSLRTLPEVGTGLSVPALITEGTRYTAENIPIDAGTIASFTASGYASLPTLTASATWHLSHAAMPRIEGKVTNATERVFEDAVVLIKGESRYLGTLGPGETRTFGITLGPQDPGSLSIGNTQSQYGYYYSYGGSWQYASNSPGWCFSHPGLPLTVPDVMRNETFSCSVGGVSQRQQELRRRYRLLGSLVVDTDLSGGRGSGAYVFAWNGDALVGVDLLGKPQGEEDTTLYIFDLPVSVVADDAQVDIPPALTTWSITDVDNPDTLRDVTPFQFRLNDSSQAAFQFIPLPGMRLSSVDELMIQFQAQGPVYVELWNWDRQSWQRISLSPDSDTTSVLNPARFVGPENAVSLRVRSDDSALYNNVDYVKVTYRGQLANE